MLIDIKKCISRILLSPNNRNNRYFILTICVGNDTFISYKQETKCGVYLSHSSVIKEISNAIGCDKSEIKILSILELNKKDFNCYIN